MKLNIRTDEDVLEKLDSVPSKQGYIKRLIRADLKKIGTDGNSKGFPFFYLEKLPILACIRSL